MCSISSNSLCFIQLTRQYKMLCLKNCLMSHRRLTSKQRSIPFSDCFPRQIISSHQFRYDKRGKVVHSDLCVMRQEGIFITQSSLLQIMDVGHWIYQKAADMQWRSFTVPFCVLVCTRLSRFASLRKYRRTRSSKCEMLFAFIIKIEKSKWSCLSMLVSHEEKAMTIATLDWRTRHHRKFVSFLHFWKPLHGAES